MSLDQSNEETILEQALSFASVEDRIAYLQGVCKGDSQVRAQVESLIAAHLAAGNFLSGTGGLPSPSISEAGQGTHIGRYKLLQKIGEGGMGIVYMAEQEEPVRRRVALKIIKLGMDSQQVVARFEAERQALAMMDHPNIAKVLDAGATELGRPYFLMELVKGIAITRYCDQENLNTEDRLRLFIQVCNAIQHAHQKGIIHRDLKPSNILIADQDGVAVSKIIDFGIAKATGNQPLTDKTLFTAFEQFIGTPAYMSPEQTKLSGLDIDTRTDVYSLGVLLYELVTGRTPFESKRLAEAGLDEARRIIQQEEPTRPSARLITMAEDQLISTSRQRQIEPLKLIRLVRGDLDWTIMKALEKDRRRRYETVNGLAMDIQRHLIGELVSARPPNAAYRLQKAVRRNKLAFIAATAALAAIICGLAISIVSVIQTKKALRRALADEATRSEAAYRLALRTDQQLLPDDFVKWETSIDGLVDALKREGKIDEVEQVFHAISANHFDEHPLNADFLNERALFLARHGRWKGAAADCAKLVAMDPTDPSLRYELIPLLAMCGDLEGYRQNCIEVLAIFGGTKVPGVADRMAKICLILPNVGVDLNAVAQLADTAVTEGQNNPNFTWFAFAKALCELRQGHFAGAIDWTQRSIATASDPFLKTENFLVIAMARFQSKQQYASRMAFAKANEVLDSKVPKEETRDAAVGLTDWLIVQMLFREANTLINGPFVNRSQNDK